MARLMSVAMTEQAVLDRTKTVTRRAGWLHAKPGDHLVLVRKAMGREPGEPVVRLAEVEVMSVHREPLGMLSPSWGRWQYGAEEVAREGFPGMEPDEFVRRFFTEAQGMTLDDSITRISWRYLNTIPKGRIWTDDARLPNGVTRITVKRCCNGCGRRLGDVHDHELDHAMAGLPLPDVTAECGCSPLRAEGPTP